MNVKKQIIPEDPRVIVSVEEGKNDMSNGCKGIAPTKVLIAKEENTKLEVGRAHLCMPNQQNGAGSYGFCTIESISPDAPDMGMVLTALVHKVREELPKNRIVLHHKGPMPVDVQGYETYSKDEFYILEPALVF